jgi:hypothetical protein
LSARTTIVSIWIDGNATTWEEYACNLNVFGVHKADKILHDDIDAIFVKGTMVAETKKVELETFAFDHFDVGDVAYAYLGKVWLPGDGTKAGEFRTVELYPIVMFGVLVVKSFEHFRGIVLTILGGVA